MNKTVSTFIRDQLKANLALCTKGEHSIFNRMYSPGNFERPVTETVDEMPDGKLDWALSQVENTLRKRAP